MNQRTEYAVKAETHEGNIFTLRGGFKSEEHAEDHPVTLSLWKRVWVEPVLTTTAPKPDPVLPPLPWDLSVAGQVDARGSFHAYIVDATGRKIAAVWGKDGEKALIANHILDCVNATKEKGAA